MLLMERIKIIGICVILLVGVFFDLHLQKIPKWYAFLFLGIGIATMFFPRDNLLIFLLGGGFGLVFFLLAKITKEGIGYGDAYLITGLGFALGIQRVFFGIIISLLLMLPVSIILLSLKKVTKKTKLPFLPFLFGGIVLQLVMGEIL